MCRDNDLSRNQGCSGSRHYVGIHPGRDIYGRRNLSELHRKRDGAFGNKPLDAATLAAKGRTFFFQSCAHCHGLDADGGEDAPSLLKLKISGAHMALVIQSGIKDEMLSFAKKYNQQDTNQKVADHHSHPIRLASSREASRRVPPSNASVLNWIAGCQSSRSAASKAPAALRRGWEFTISAFLRTYSSPSAD